MERMIIDDFLDFEKENSLFEVVDGKGFHVWDIIRGVVYEDLEGITDLPELEINKSPNKILTSFKNILKAILYFFSCWRRKYLLLICSRSYDAGSYFDKIADSVIGVLGMNSIYCVETYGFINEKGYKYGKVSPSVADTLRFICHSNYDMTMFENMLKSKFPKVKLNPNRWLIEYKRFYARYYFYRFLIKTKHIEKCFVVQNGFQKGLYAAARSLGVQIIELQHGAITYNHQSYSYPLITNLIDKVYNPNVLLTFGEFWGKDCFMPGTVVEALGNDYYHICSDNKTDRDKRGILVVSAKGYGVLLSDVIMAATQKDAEHQLHFYYKLHPNEKIQYDNYVRLFSDYPNIEVVDSSYLMPDLLSKVSFILTVESTVEYEALTMGVKVMALKRLDYKFVGNLLDEEGVFVIDNEDDLINVYTCEKDTKIKDYADYFFKPFDVKVLEKFM